MTKPGVEAWEEIARGLPGNPGPPRRIIVESWNRSRLAGVPKDGAACFRKVPAVEFQKRRENAAEVLELTVPHLEWVSGMLSLEAIPHTIYLADRDGIVLWSKGTSAEEMEQAGLVPGYDWSEAAMGTNGAGTAITTGRPVVILGDEHYSSVWHGFT
jgi:transcriptional regulator of acetoin/glycerol metabolism